MGYIVNDRPVHSTGKAFSRHKTLGNGLWWCSPPVAPRRTLSEVWSANLLDHCGVRAGRRVAAKLAGSRWLTRCPKPGRPSGRLPVHSSSCPEPR